MAKSLLCPSALNSFISSNLSSSTSSKNNQIACSGNIKNQTPSLSWNRRELSLGFMSTFLAVGLVGNNDRRSRDANAAILEADDDEELLEKVKQDRKKRIERQAVLNSAVKEKGTSRNLCLSVLLQNLVLVMLCLCVDKKIANYLTFSPEKN